MFIYNIRYSVLSKAIAAVLVCLFIANDISYAAPSFDYNNPSKVTNLAPALQVAQKSFQDKFILGEFAFSLEGMKDYINEQIAKEKGIFNKENEWKDRRTKAIPDINDPSIKGRIKGLVGGLKQVVFVRVAGLLSSTGQPAFVDLTGKVGVSKEFGGIPVVYIDSTLTGTPDICIQRHEIDEIKQWEDFRQNMLGIETNEEMADWITGHLESSDTKLKGTACEGLNALQIAELFHGYSYPLRDLYKNLKGTTDLDHGYIRTMLQLYPLAETKGVNVAAKGGFDASFKGKKRTGVSNWELLRKELRKRLATLPQETVNRLRQIKEIGEIKKFLVDSGVDVAQAIDGRFLVREVELFLRQIPATVSDKVSARRNRLRWAGAGRKLVAYWSDDFDFIVKTKVDKKEVKLEDVLKQWIGQGYRVASERLNGLAVPTMIIDAIDGSKKPFSYLLENGGIKKSDLVIVQRKVIPLLDHMKSLVKAGKITQAQELVDRYKELIVAIFKRGVIDLDYTYPYNNCGIDPETGKLYLFDFGDLYADESDVGTYFENLGVSNKCFYDDLNEKVGQEVARYFAIFPLAADDFYTPQGESLFGVDLKSGNVESFKMTFPYSENKIRAIFMDHTMNHSDAKLPPADSITREGSNLYDMGQVVTATVVVLIAGGLIAKAIITYFILRYLYKKGWFQSLINSEHLPTFKKWIDRLFGTPPTTEAKKLPPVADTQPDERLMPRGDGMDVPDEKENQMARIAAAAKAANPTVVVEVEPSSARVSPSGMAPDIEKTLQILSGLKKEDEGGLKYYTVRYNATKIPRGSPAESLLKTYVEKVLPMYMSGKDRIKLTPSGAQNQSLISVECYKDRSRSQAQAVGEGHVDLDEDINGKALRLIGILNMAFVASQIPKDISANEMSQYDNIISFIKEQYKEISGEELAEDILKDISKGIWIKLPHAAPVPLEKVDEYYRLTITQLEQAA